MPEIVIGSAPVSWERVARASGIIAASLGIIALLVAGTNFPGVTASVPEISAYYDDNHRRVMLTFLILAGTVTFFFWFVGAIASALREAGYGGWAATALALGSVRAATILLHMMVVGGLAFRTATSSEPGVVQAFQDLQWAIRVTSFFPVAGLVFATAVAFRRAGLVPAWFSWIFVPGSFVVFLGGTTWDQSGFWAPDGGFSLIAVAIGLAWMYTMSGLLLRLAPSSGRAPAPTVAAPAQR